VAERLVFRRPLRRIVLATVGMGALFACLIACQAVMSHTGRLEMRGSDLLVGVVAAVTAAGVLALVARQRVVLTEDTLTTGKDTVRWADVTEAAPPAFHWFRRDVLVLLRLSRPLPRGWGVRLWPHRLVVPGGWADSEHLMREIVARVPPGTVSPALRATLETPARVLWRHRLLALASLAAVATAAAFALADAVAHGIPGVIPAYVLAGLAPGLLLTSGVLAREWRVKTVLVSGAGLLALGGAVGMIPATLLARMEVLAVVYAAALGWTLAALVVSLPGRPPAWTVALGFTAAVAVCVVPTWWLAVREPVPIRRLPPLKTFPSGIAWSADGQTFGLHVTDDRSELGAYLVVEAASLASRRVLVSGLAHSFCFLHGGRLVHLSEYFGRDAERNLTGVRRVWVRERDEPAPIPIALPDAVRAAVPGFVSPGRRRAIVLAEVADDVWGLHEVDLAAHSVRRLGGDANFTQFGCVRWTAAGGWVLVERGDPNQRPDYFALWTLGSDATARTRFYEARARQVWAGFAPGGRYALVAIKNQIDRFERYDLVDLVARTSRALHLPGQPATHEMCWDPAGEWLAYAAGVEGSPALVLVHAASGRVTTPYAAPDGTIVSVALSRGARFAVCMVDGGRGTRVRLVETASGRTLTLRRPMRFTPSVVPSWSPVGHTLALAYPHRLLGREVVISLLDLDEGW